MDNIVILGAGMAGFGAASRLRHEGVGSTLYEKQPYYGGHTASFTHGDFVFDDGPHISFTKVERIQRLFAENINHDHAEIRAKVNNYWRGFWIKHPVQCNLHGLPADLVVAALQDFIQAQSADATPAQNYADWLLASFGRTLAETFPMAYGLKYHTTEAANMSTDWLGPRLYRPELAEVLRGAVTSSTGDVHYITNFRYPLHNGFVSYLVPFTSHTDLRLDHELVAIDPVGRTLRFKNGTETQYEHLISSIPLPELIPLIAGAPSDVLQAAGRLACTTCVIVNVGIDRADISDAHWTYFYDSDFFFTRLSFPHMLSPFNAPPGCGSIQAEVYYSKKYRPLDRAPADCIEPVVSDLRRCGLLRETDRILVSNATLCPYANVIFDLDRAAALTIVHGYLDELGIQYCGRYGDWGYLWTDDAFISGEHAAQRILDRMTSPMQPAASVLRDRAAMPSA
jgi:protoporphyrinogen oxidase